MNAFSQESGTPGGLNRRALLRNGLLVGAASAVGLGALAGTAGHS